MAALLVLARRVAGALNEPLGLSSLVVLAILFALAAIALRALQTSRTLRALAATALLILACAVSVPGAIGWQLGLFWLLVLTSPAILFVQVGNHPLRGHFPRSWDFMAFRPSITTAEPPAKGDGAVQPSAEMGLADFRDSMAEENEGLRQSWTRIRRADGCETIQGTLRAELAVGQRSAVLHVAFCPPFSTIPEVEFEQVEGPEATVKPATLLPYGARLEARLQRPAAEATIVGIDFVASGQAIHTES